MEQEFHGIKRLPPYVFAEVNALKARARAAGEDIIDFGMGNPDQPPPSHVTDKLIEVVQNPRVHRYSTSRGIPGLRKAVAAYYQRRFGVDLDPDRETIVTLGSKEGLANLCQAITSPGDVILVPNPSYPIHAFGFIIAGAAIRALPMGPGFDFMAQLDRALRHSVPKPLSTSSRTWPMPRSISRARRRRRSSRCPAPRMWRSSSPPSARPTPCPAGGSDSAAAMPS
jgi:alanine-synthesizing transaminase